MASFRVGEVVSESFRLVFGNFGAFVTTQGVPLLILAALSFPLQVLIAPEPVSLDFTNATATSAAAARQNQNSGASALGSLVGLASFFVGIATAAIGLVVADALRAGGRLTLKEAWARAKPRYGNLLGTTLLIVLVIIAIFVGASIVAIPAIFIGIFSGELLVPILLVVLAFCIAIGVTIWFALRWAIASPISVFEANSATENLARSTQLTKGSRGAIFGSFVLVWLIAFLPTVIVVAVTVGHALSGVANKLITPLPLEVRALNWVLTTLSSVLGGALLAAASLVVYRKLAPPPAPLATAEPPPY